MNNDDNSVKPWNLIDGSPRSLEEVAKERLDICSSCEFFFKNQICKKCGCFMLLKVKLDKAKCPVGKW
jgi:hypothetical protein